VAGDFSPLTIDGRDGPRAAPPALVVAMAVGLGSMDMPVPSIAEWEWLNWKFPRSIRAGDTIYARWTLTQKRPPRSGAPSAVVVWRVDVHTADGAMCAEGEVGAKVKREQSGGARPAAEPAPAQAGSAPRRRRRRSRSNGAGTDIPEPPAIAAPPAATAKPERASGPARRRRRRRSSGSMAREEEHEPRAAHTPETAAPPAAETPAPAGASKTTRNRGLGGVLRRLRGT